MPPSPHADNSCTRQRGKNLRRIEIPSESILYKFRLSQLASQRAPSVQPLALAEGSADRRIAAVCHWGLRAGNRPDLTLPAGWPFRIVWSASGVDLSYCCTHPPVGGLTIDTPGKASQMQRKCGRICMCDALHPPACTRIPNCACPIRPTTRALPSHWAEKKKTNFHKPLFSLGYGGGKQMHPLDRS